MPRRSMPDSDGRRWVAWQTTPRAPAVPRRLFAGQLRLPGINLLPHCSNAFGNRRFARLLLVAPFELDDPFLQALAADRDSQREADEVGVLELGSGPEVAVIEEDVDAGREELGVVLLGD